MLPEDFRKLRPLRPVKGKYGEPEDWDGLSSLFIMQASKTPQIATRTELKMDPGAKFKVTHYPNSRPLSFLTT